MLLKLASMFLTNIFYYPKVFFKIKERDTRLLHFWIILYKLYDIYLKVDSGLANTKLRNSASKFIVTFKFLKYFSLLVCQHQNIILTTFGLFIKFLD